MAEALQNVVAMFLIMAASYALMMRSPYPVEVINNLVFNFFLPVTVFTSIYGLQRIPAGEFLAMAASGFAAMVVTAAFAAAATRLGGIRDRRRKTFILGASYGNHVFLGFPVCYAFLGDRGMVLAMFFTIGSYFFLYVVGTCIMTGRVTPAAFLKNPLILATAAGCLCVLLGCPIPSVLDHTFSLMNKATFPLSMMVVGGGLRLGFFADPGRIRLAACASAIKLGLGPLAAWGICLAAGLSGDQTAVCVLQSAMPTAVLVSIFSVQYDADPVFSNAIVSLTTLASIGIIPMLFLMLN